MWVEIKTSTGTFILKYNFLVCYISIAGVHPLHKRRHGIVLDP